MGYFKGKKSRGLKISRAKRSTYHIIRKRKSAELSPRPPPYVKRGKLSITCTPRTPSSRRKKRPLSTPGKSARKQTTFKSPHKMTPYKLTKRLCTSSPLKGRYQNNISVCTIRSQISQKVNHPQCLWTC